MTIDLCKPVEKACAALASEVSQELTAFQFIVPSSVLNLAFPNSAPKVLLVHNNLIPTLQAHRSNKSWKHGVCIHPMSPDTTARLCIIVTGSHHMAEGPSEGHTLTESKNRQNTENGQLSYCWWDEFSLGGSGRYA
eukprot:3410829-Amphidinium_carterae.1